MRPLFAAFAALALLASPAFAADAPKSPSTSLAGVPGGRYNLDPAHANVLFSLSHMGFSHYYGRFNKIEGTLFLDNSNPLDSGVKITIDMNGIDTNNEKLESELKSKDWFDVATFPTASFTSTKVDKISDSKAKVTGDLSIHGVTRPVVLDVTFNGTAINPFAKGQAMGFSATTKINRSDFGVKNYIPMVGDEVTLIIEAEFQQAKE